jgi:hypothetical protein
MIELRDAQRAIEPIQSALIEGLTTASKRWQRLLTKTPELGLPLDATTRACFIHNHACSEVTQLTAEHSNVTLPEKLDFFALLVGDEILLRLKFVGGGAPRNYPTGQQRQLSRQEFTPEIMVTLDGISAPPTLLTCGYTLDTAAIGRIEIRRDCIGRQPWNYDIYGGEAVAEPLVIPTMTDTTKPAIVTSTRKALEGESHAEKA